MKTYPIYAKKATLFANVAAFLQLFFAKNCTQIMQKTVPYQQFENPPIDNFYYFFQIVKGGTSDCQRGHFRLSTGKSQKPQPCKTKRLTSDFSPMNRLMNRFMNKSSKQRNLSLTRGKNFANVAFFAACFFEKFSRRKMQ